MNNITTELLNLFIHEPYILSKVKEAINIWYDIHKFNKPNILKNKKYIQAMEVSVPDSGRTSRCIDNAIQELYQNGMTIILDPSCKNKYRGEKIVKTLEKRLINEHNMQAGRIKYEIFGSDELELMKQYIFDPYQFSYVRKAMDHQDIKAIWLRMIN